MKPKIVSILGTRPQYIKYASFANIAKERFNLIALDTGQHYDYELSEIFINELKIPKIKYNLNIGSFSHSQQVGKMMQKIEPILMEERPAVVVVFGDTNSTLSGALVAAKLCIPVMHIEAGMRNFNLNIPEEINRLVTDVLSAIAFAPTQTAVNNLKRDGLSEDRIKYVGDIGISLLRILEDKKIHTKFAIPNFSYYFTTIHRPYNTESKERFIEVLGALNHLPLKVCFPIHLGTMTKINSWGIDMQKYKNIVVMKPVSFFENIVYMKNSAAIITDSGSMQKEAYYFKKQCITIAPSTPWEETLIGNWNQLIFNNLSMIPKKLNNQPSENLYNINIFGEKDAAHEIVEEICKYVNN